MMIAVKDLCGSVLCIDAVELLKSLPTGSVGAWVSDPPFFVSTGRRGGGVGDDPWLPGISTVDAMVDWSVPLANEVHRVLRPGGAAVIMGGSQSISAWEVAASRAGLRWMAELTVLWNTGKPRSRNFGSLTTTIRWYSKAGARYEFNSGIKRAIYSNVVVCDKMPLSDRQHQSQKPVELTNFLISLLTRDDDLVVDTFAGSGSTLVSAEMLGRPWIGGDVDGAMCRVAERRTSRPEFEEALLRPLHLWINGKIHEIEG